MGVSVALWGRAKYWSGVGPQCPCNEAMGECDKVDYQEGLNI